MRKALTLFCLAFSLGATHAADELTEHKAKCDAGNVVGCATATNMLIELGQPLEALVYAKKGIKIPHKKEYLPAPYLERNGYGEEISAKQKALERYALASCQYNAAFLLLTEFSSFSEAKDALKYAQQSCDTNHGLGCAMLALIYHHPPYAKVVGINTDDKKSLEINLKACRYQSGAGCKGAAILLSKSSNTFEAAKALVRHACKYKDGMPLPQDNECLAEGQALALLGDMPSAANALSKACAQKNEIACEEFKQLPPSAFSDGAGVF